MIVRLSYFHLNGMHGICELILGTAEFAWETIAPLRVSCETCFDSKQPKLEPKLVSALSETKRLFRLFRFYTETEIFDVSIEPKQTDDQP